MKLWIMSDLHIDVRAKTAPFSLPEQRPECDAVIIAGDIRENAVKSVRWIAEQDFGVPVFFVPGNHEFYGEAIDKNMEKAEAEAEELGVHLLNGGCVIMRNEYLFTGCTLWTDYELYGTRDLSMLIAEHGMNDHRKIRLASAGYRRFLPRDAREKHLDDVRAINTALLVTEAKKKIVITHHAPSVWSIDKKYICDPLNPAFASRLEHLMDGVDIWVHGHVHSRFDYTVGDCRVICNPRGYVGAGEVTGFDPSLVVEV